MSEVQFKSWPKTKRYEADHLICIITEKLDGSNALIVVTEDGQVLAGSRHQFIDKARDNFGFAAWVEENENELLKLGPGYHYGEWIGEGIQRGYDMTDRKLFLFNPGRYMEQEHMADCVSFVPLVGTCDLRDLDCTIDLIKNSLMTNGSKIGGFARVEGLIIEIPTIGYRRKVIWDK